MTTLEKLREAHQKRCKTANVGGVDIVLAPMTAAAGMALLKSFAAIDGMAADDPRLVDFYCEMIVKCAVEPGTAAKALDSDEGRELVRGLPMQELLELGFLAAEVNGFAKEKDESDAKKN